MRFSTSALVERNVRITGEFETEPYEAGWATEARWFVNVIEGVGSWEAQCQISPDGQTWCELAETTVAGPGVATVGVTLFGHWLRLRLRPLDSGATMRANVYLALKE